MSDFFDDTRRRGRRERADWEDRGEEWRSRPSRGREYAAGEDEMRWGDWDMRSDPWGEMRQERDWEMERDPDGLRRGRRHGPQQQWQSQMNRVYGREDDEQVERDDWDREMRARGRGGFRSRSGFGEQGYYGRAPRYGGGRGGEFDREYGRGYSPEYGEDYGGFVGRPSEAEWRESGSFRRSGSRGSEDRGREYQGPGYRRRETGGPETWGLEDEGMGREYRGSSSWGSSELRESGPRGGERRSYGSGPGGYGLSRGNYGYNRGFRYPDRGRQSSSPGPGWRPSQSIEARWEDLGQSEIYGRRGREQQGAGWSEGDTGWDDRSTRNRRSAEDWERDRGGRWMESEGRGSLEQAGYVNRGRHDRGTRRTWDRGYGSGLEPDYDITSAYSENWDIPGPYAGIGPKGYQRTDDRICEDVCERLTQHGRLDATGIDVEVEQGEVRLKGTVVNRRAKRLAEDIAESVSGVFDVDNQLRVQQSEQDDTTRRGSRVGSEQSQSGGPGFTREYEGGSRAGRAEAGRTEMGSPNLAGARTSEANLGGAQPGGAASTTATNAPENRGTGMSGGEVGEIVPRTQPVGSGSTGGFTQVFPYPEQSAAPLSGAQSSEESDLNEIWNPEAPSGSTPALGDTRKASPVRREPADLGDTQPSIRREFRETESYETWGGAQSGRAQEVEEMQRSEADESGVWRVTMPTDAESASEPGTSEGISHIKAGMQVVGSDGRPVGHVKELRQNDLLVDRPLARDIYVPFNACEISRGQVRLNVTAAEVDEQGWPKPDLFGG